MNSLDTLSLLDAAQGGDNDACERLLLENSGLIWSVARRYYGRGVDPEDLYQLGCLGFLKAVRGFDTRYGTQFSTYAVPKIAGEIRRFLRDDGSVKVSRGIKERAMALRQCRQDLYHRLGRDPTVGELAQATGLEPEDSRDRHPLGGLPPEPDGRGRLHPGVHSGLRRHGRGSGGAAGPAPGH